MGFLGWRRKRRQVESAPATVAQQEYNRLYYHPLAKLARYERFQRENRKNAQDYAQQQAYLAKQPGLYSQQADAFASWGQLGYMTPLQQQQRLLGLGASLPPYYMPPILGAMPWQYTGWSWQPPKPRVWVWEL